MFTSFIKREIRKFHVAVVQRRQRNVQKKRDAHEEDVVLLIWTSCFFAVFVAVAVAKAFYRPIYGVLLNNLIECYTPDIVIKFILPLCLKTLILAPESLAPKMREVWLSSSLMIKSPFPTRAGIFAELVANPIPNTIAAGLPTNRATRPSSSLWMARVPDNKNLNITQITIQKAKEKAGEVKMGTVYVLCWGHVSQVLWPRYLFRMTLSTCPQNVTRMLTF